MSGYLYLAIAITAEVVATTAIKALDGLSKPVPLLLVVLGIVLVSVAAAVLYQQRLDLPAMLGMGLIVSGVAVIQLFSHSTGH